MKRKFWRIVMVVILAGALSIMPGNAQAEKAKETNYISLGSSGSGGSAALIANAFAIVINQHSTNVTATVRAVEGGGMANVRMIGRGQLDFGQAPLDVVIKGYNGTDEYQKEGAYKKIRLVAYGLGSPWNLIVRKDSPYLKVSDMKGATMATISGGNFSIYVPDTFVLLGLKKDVDYKLLNLNSTEAVEAFKDGRVDAVVSYSAIPNPSFEELASVQKVRWIGMDDNLLKKITEAYPWMKPWAIPANTYNGQTEAINGALLSATYITSSDVSEDVVYQVTKAIMENNTQVKKIFRSAGEFSPERQVQVMGDKAPDIPLHPGAEKYYREKHLLKW
jgi:TRAP transporter TAXI family solute receptor